MISHPFRHSSNNVWPSCLLLVLAAALPGMAVGEDMPRKPDLSDMVLIPAGDFIMGSDKVEKSNKSGEFGNVKPWYMDEHPKHHENLPAYYIEEHEVTNGQYLKFVTLSGRGVPEYWLKNGYVLTPKADQLKGVSDDKLRQLAVNVIHLDKDTRKMSKQELLHDITETLHALDNLPVAEVNWYQAEQYCKWAGLRLPTEAEWEKAARGTHGATFPWGNEWHTNMSNTGSEQWDTNVAPIKSYKTDKSPFGIYDMAGNVSEWVQDWYKPYKGSDYQSKDFGEKFKVARGAGWSGGEGHYALRLFQRGAYRGNLPPDGTYDDVGFRCAANVTVAKHQ